MGQAIDLPDPLDAASPLKGASLDRDSAACASSANADDILSQLAGDEIDRLLAEAEIEKSSSDAFATTELSADIAPQPSIDDPLETEVLDAVLDNAASSPAATSPFAVAADAPPIDATALSPAEPVNPANAVLALPGPTPNNSVFSAPADETGSISASAPLALPSEPSEQDDWLDDERPLPIFLRPLAWLNAPFDALPDTAREILGKVAILTLFNAVAVLVYVIVFRK